LKAQGLQDLVNLPKSGRPAKADQAYLQVVEETLEQGPGELGFDFNLWTIQWLAPFYAAIGRDEIDQKYLLFFAILSITIDQEISGHENTFRRSSYPEQWIQGE
jgi:hypothetical protein